MGNLTNTLRDDGFVALTARTLMCDWLAVPRPNAPHAVHQRLQLIKRRRAGLVSPVARSGVCAAGIRDPAPCFPGSRAARTGCSRAAEPRRARSSDLLRLPLTDERKAGKTSTSLGVHKTILQSLVCNYGTTICQRRNYRPEYANWD